jgi:hypothetical protein
MVDRKTLHAWKGVVWAIEHDYNDAGDEETYAIARCPNKDCHCPLKLLWLDREQDNAWHYSCINCDFAIKMQHKIDDMGYHLLQVLESQDYKDAEIIKVDGELITVRRGNESDSDYWVDARLSKNKQGKMQLMVLAGSKKEQDKAQLFLDLANERLSFDQNDDHPKDVFAKVVATFRDSATGIESSGSGIEQSL